MRVGSEGKVKHRFKINQDGAGKSRGSREEVATRNRAFQMQLSLGKVVPFLVVKILRHSGRILLGGPHEDTVREYV